MLELNAINGADVPGVADPTSVAVPAIGVAGVAAGTTATGTDMAVVAPGSDAAAIVSGRVTRPTARPSLVRIARATYAPGDNMCTGRAA